MATLVGTLLVEEAIAASALITGYLASPQGQRQVRDAERALGDAINATGDALAQVFSSSSTGTTATCPAAAKEKAKSEPDDPCRPLRRQKEELGKRYSEAQKRSRDWNKQRSPEGSGIHPSVLERYSVNRDSSYALSPSDYDAMRRDTKIVDDQLWEEEKEVCEAFRDAGNKLRACESETEKKTEEKRQKTLREEADQQAQEEFEKTRVGIRPLKPK